MEEKMVKYFKTFVDLNRLRLAALLSEKACTVEEIAFRLQIKMSDVPRHLHHIEKIGLLRKEADRYRLDVKALEMLSKEVLAERREGVEARSNDANASDSDRQIVRNYLRPDGRLKEIPAQEKKLLPILRHVVQAFEPGVRYNERHVNETLARYHEDYASLRRYLVDRQMIKRESNGTMYWRT